MVAMARTLVEDLREELARGEVLVVVGTGVSIQASGGAICAQWDGLILDGIDHGVGKNILTESEAHALRQKLKKQNVAARLAVAQRVSEALGAPDGEFLRWLGESVGKLPLKNGSIVDAIHSLSAPVATTNYDHLLTQGRGIEHVPWTDVPAAQAILHGHHKAVLHLHGCFDHPNSVVLGVKSYQRVLKSQGAQGIQKAIGAVRSLLFIGCGDGLLDPNLGALMKWLGAAFGKSGYRHYRLCLTEEQKPPEKRLFYVPYGTDVTDLAPFLRGLAPRKSVLPLPNPGHCFGREREVEEVVAALVADRPQPLPILGGPGMGKTTIALKALHDPRVAGRFGKRRWFVRCDGVTTRAELAAAIARALDLPVTVDVEPAVLTSLASAPAALVLDNGETPLDGDDGRQVEEFLALLAIINSLALIVTIRGHKRPRGVPWLPDVEAERLTDAAAAKVLVAVSGKLSFADDPHLSRLIVVLDGVPLAITLMACYAELYDSLDPVWSRWKSKRTAMLRDGKELDRLRNLAVSYELSIGVLAADARRLLSTLAMLPDGAAHGDLEGIFANPDDAADELRRRALVFDDAQRLRMRAPLREYVVAVHTPNPADERRAVDFYLGLAAREGVKLGRAAEAVERLTSEAANVETMLDKSSAMPGPALDSAVYGWANLMRFTGVGSTGPIERIAAKALSSGSFHIAMTSFNSLGDIALERADQETARRYYEHALALFEEVGSVLGKANSIKGLGDIALKFKDHDAAHARYGEAMQLYRQVGNVLGEANCIRRLGNIALESGDHDAARTRYEDALPLYRELGEVLGEANCIRGLGDVAVAKKAEEDAELNYHRSLELYEQIAAPYAIGQARRRLARLASDEATRSTHITAAREAWRSIKHDDLLAELDDEFGAG